MTTLELAHRRACRLHRQPPRPTGLTSARAKAPRVQHAQAFVSLDSTVYFRREPHQEGAARRSFLAKVQENGLDESSVACPLQQAPSTSSVPSDYIPRGTPRSDPARPV